jgi:hypothetical protein
VEALKVVDPYDSKAVQDIQNRIAVAESIMGWLGDAVAEGQSAIEQLKGEDE